MDAEEIQFTSFDEHDIAEWQEVERGEILALPELTATEGVARVELARYDEEQQQWCRYGYTNVTADSVEGASNAWEAAQEIANFVNARKRPLGESVIEQMPSYPQKKWAQSLYLENDPAPEPEEEEVLRTGGPQRDGQPYEIIRVSPSVRIQFDSEKNVLRIGGDGICSLGHVGCPVTVRGKVYADIETIEGNVWCEGDASATIGTAKSVRVFDNAKLTVRGEVEGNARCCGNGEFVGNIVRGDTFAEDNSELIVESVGGGKTAMGNAFLLVDGERIEPQSESEGEGIKI